MRRRARVKNHSATWSITVAALMNCLLKIPLPSALDEISKGLRMLGQGKDADDLVATMNRAVEQAVPQANELLMNAVKNIGR